MGIEDIEGVCVVAKDNAIYFVGGINSASKHWYIGHRYVGYEILRYADRYDLDANTWDKIADPQERRNNACGAAAYGQFPLPVAKAGQRQPVKCTTKELTHGNTQRVGSPVSKIP